MKLPKLLLEDRELISAWSAFIGYIALFVLL